MEMAPTLCVLDPGSKPMLVATRSAASSVRPVIITEQRPRQQPLVILESIPGAAGGKQQPPPQQHLHPTAATLFLPSMMSMGSLKIFSGWATATSSIDVPPTCNPPTPSTPAFHSHTETHRARRPFTPPPNHPYIAFRLHSSRLSLH